MRNNVKPPPRQAQREGLWKRYVKWAKTPKGFFILITIYALAFAYVFGAFNDSSKTKPPTSSNSELAHTVPPTAPDLHMHTISKIEVLRAVANSGDAKAQYELGKDYANGKGTPRDYAKAAYWWRKAADQGNAEAEVALGKSYALCRGVPASAVQATYWYRKAANQGYAPGEDKLGDFYMDKMPLNKIKAFNHIKKIDANNGYYWIRKAAHQGYGPAQIDLSVIYMGKSYFHKDDQKATYWARKGVHFLNSAARQGSARAEDDLGRLYWFGFWLGFPKNHTKSAYWYRKAADQGGVPAELTMANFYSDEFVFSKPSRAKSHPATNVFLRSSFSWLLKAARQGSATAEYEVARSYFIGAGVTKNKIKGFYWNRKAADQGNVSAMSIMANSYLYGGKLIPKNAVKAKYWKTRVDDYWSRCGSSTGVGDLWGRF